MYILISSMCTVAVYICVTGWKYVLDCVLVGAKPTLA